MFYSEERSQQCACPLQSFYTYGLPVNKTKNYGIEPRNAEQSFAFEILNDPDIKLVALTGKAGTGKTLLALGGSLG